MSEMTFQTLLDQIDRMISLYQWTVGTFIAIILGAVGFFGFVQWRMKKEQEEKIKKEILETFSSDIAEVLGPIIVDSLEQKQSNLSVNYKRNIEIWNKYLFLNSKYSFSEEVRCSIFNYRLIIMQNFTDQLRAKTNMHINNLDIHNEYMNIINENYVNRTLIPPNELTKILKKVAKENQEDGVENYEEEEVTQILTDYQKFYKSYNEL